jgi:hypothetical protein
MNVNASLQRAFRIGLFGGVLIFALGFANVFDIADPPTIFTVFAPYGQELLILGIIISSIAGAGLFVLKRLS